MRVVHGTIILLLLTAIGLQIRLIDVTTRTHDLAMDAAYGGHAIQANVAFITRRTQANTPDPCQDVDYSDARNMRGCPEMGPDDQPARAPGRTFWDRFWNNPPEDQ